MLLCIEAFFALEPKMILLNQWRPLGLFEQSPLLYGDIKE